MEMENNDNSWMKSMLARMEGVPRSGELFVPTNATNLSLGKDGVELSTVGGWDRVEWCACQIGENLRRS